ncbi:MAG: DUF72 domain-containing protein [Polyangiaceae bacterium]
MITIGCAGFAVPATKYLKEFLFVEVQETHLTVPGPGTIRRWRREAPPSFEFALLAPREIGQESFRLGKVIESAIDNLDETKKELAATTIVFTSPPDFAETRPNKAAVKEFLTAIRGRYDRVVWEPPPSWNPDDIAPAVEGAGALCARDPLRHGTSKGKVAYYRLPGPAGHKSRYEDPSIDKLAELAKAAGHDAAHFIFSNVDMFADAKRLRKLLKV